MNNLTKKPTILFYKAVLIAKLILVTYQELSQQ